MIYATKLASARLAVLTALFFPTGIAFGGTALPFFPPDQAVLTELPAVVGTPVVSSLSTRLANESDYARLFLTRFASLPGASRQRQCWVERTLVGAIFLDSARYVRYWYLCADKWKKAARQDLTNLMTYSDARLGKYAKVKKRLVELIAYEVLQWYEYERYIKWKCIRPNATALERSRKRLIRLVKAYREVLERLRRWGFEVE